MRNIRWLVLFCFAALTSAFADQTISNGKWWNSGGAWWYVNSSMGNLLVPDGAASGDEITSFYRRSGEAIMIEEVPYTGFHTGSYWQSGSFYVMYQVWTDSNTTAKWGKFTAYWWYDTTNNNWAQQWVGRVTCFNLQASTGQYVTAENGGGSTVVANRTAAYAWEEFTMWAPYTQFLQDGDQIIVGTRDALTFLTAEGGGGQTVVANRTAVGPWERFTIHKIAPAPGTANDQYLRSGDQVAISVDNGQYWSAVNGGGSGVTADRNSAGPWETFTITFINPGGR